MVLIRSSIRAASRQSRTFATSAPKHNAAQQAKQVAQDATQQAKQATESATQQAKSVAESATHQAKQASGQAGNTLENLTKKAQEIGGPVVKRVEGLLGGYSEPLKYNLSVAGSIAKQVYVAEGLAPPTSINTITSAYRQIWSKLTDKAYYAQLLTKGDWKKVAIYGVEAYGIFTIGEMIGRRSIVGYKLDTSNHGHHGHH